jgi:hypothetical protein
MANNIVEQSAFDSIRKFDKSGNEFWMARDLMELLKYAKWQRFEDAISRAQSACESAGIDVTEHFHRLPSSVNGHGEGRGRKPSNFKLSRYAVRLIWENICHTKKYCKRQIKDEKSVQKALAEVLDGKTEIETLCGRIDILTPTEIIEVKRVKDWKSALGQIIVYGDYYPSHQKRIHLYGETQEAFLSLITKHCERRKVVVTWEP